MKIAVYTIALNEKQFVERWYNSAKHADYLLIADTGSTDGTIELARSLGINVIDATTNPWRFDVARNKALDALPENIDWCIALDMDEILVGDWRKQFEMVNKPTTRIRYEYTWSWKPDGTPDLVYGGDKIHTRHGYVWKHPVHEVLVCEGEEYQEWNGLKIHHYPDHSKSRSSYFPLLKMAVEEDPDDDRNAFYYARELYFNGMLEEAVAEFKRHLSLPKAVWKPERAASYRYLAKCEPYQKEYWLRLATDEAPDRREAWVELAQFYYEKNRWFDCLQACDKSLRIKQKPLEYLCEDFAWGSLPYDLAGIACWHLGLHDIGRKYVVEALRFEPNDDRLLKNLELYDGLQNRVPYKGSR